MLQEFRSIKSKSNPSKSRYNSFIRVELQAMRRKVDHFYVINPIVIDIDLRLAMALIDSLHRPTVRFVVLRMNHRYHP